MLALEQERTRTAEMEAALKTARDERSEEAAAQARADDDQSANQMRFSRPTIAACASRCGSMGW